MTLQITNPCLKLRHFFSNLLFLWVFPLFWKGSTKNVSHEDLETISDEITSERLVKKLEMSAKHYFSFIINSFPCIASKQVKWYFEPRFYTFFRAWEEEKFQSALKGKPPSLFRALLKSFGSTYALYILVFMVDGWIVRYGNTIIYFVIKVYK